MYAETVIEKRTRLKPTIVEEYTLRDIKLLKGLTERELVLVELSAVCKSFKKSSVIYSEGSRHSGIYIVQKGVVKIHKIGANGKQQILRFAQKGDIIAYRSLLTNELACTSAKACDDVVVNHIPHHILLDLLRQNWDFTHGMMKMMCTELRDSNTFVTDMAQKSVRERTAEMLLFLKDKFGIDRNGVLKITLTREDLANLVGTTTESLIRSITEFRVEGLLATPGRKIVLLDVSKLKKVANI
jgi:CRP-like cAMP-binding protein